MKVIQEFENTISTGLLENITTWMNESNLVDIDCGIQENVIGCDLPETNWLYDTLKEASFKYLNEYLCKFDPIPYELELAAVDVFRYPAGTYCKRHQGVELLSEDGRLQSRLVVIMLFLNDNFDGGELYFPDHDLVVTPKARKMVAFPTSFTVPHGVHPIIKGTRDVLGFNFAISGPVDKEGKQIY